MSDSDEIISIDRPVGYMLRIILLACTMPQWVTTPDEILVQKSLCHLPKNIRLKKIVMEVETKTILMIFLFTNNIV